MIEKNELSKPSMGVALAVSSLPVIVSVLVGVGHPAGWLAISCLIAAHGVGAVYRTDKIEQLQAEVVRAVNAEIGVVDARVDTAIDAAEHAVNVATAADADVKRAMDSLSPAQRMQIGDILEETLRTNDEAWLQQLRAAASGVVAETVESSTRKAILANLRMLGPIHIAVLSDAVAETKRKGRPDFFRADKSVPGEVWAVLNAVGFITLTENPYGRDVPHFHLTPLGHAAVELLST